MRSASRLALLLALVALGVFAEQSSSLVKNATAGGRFYGEGGNYNGGGGGSNYQRGGNNYNGGDNNKGNYQSDDYKGGRKPNYGSSPAPSLVDEYVCDLEGTILVVASSNNAESGAKGYSGGKRPVATPNAVRLKCSHIATRSDEDCQQCCQLAARADHSVSRSDITGFIINADEIDDTDYKKRSKRQTTYQPIAPAASGNYDGGVNTYAQPAAANYQQQPAAAYQQVAQPTVANYAPPQQQQPSYAAPPAPAVGYQPAAAAYNAPSVGVVYQQSAPQPPAPVYQQPPAPVYQQPPAPVYQQPPSVAAAAYQQPSEYQKQPSAQTGNSYGYPAPSHSYAAAPSPAPSAEYAPQTPSADYASSGVYASSFTYEFFGVPKNRRCVCCAPKRYDNAPADYRQGESSSSSSSSSRRYRQQQSYGSQQPQY